MDTMEPEIDALKAKVAELKEVVKEKDTTILDLQTRFLELTKLISSEDAASSRTSFGEDFRQQLQSSMMEMFNRMSTHLEAAISGQQEKNFESYAAALQENKILKEQLEDMKRELDLKTANEELTETLQQKVEEIKEEKEKMQQELDFCNSQEERTKKMIEEKILEDNINAVLARPNKGNTVWEAARDGNLNVVKIALMAGGQIDFHHSGEKDKTPLMIASEKGYLDVVNHLIEKGAGVNRMNKYKLTALILAARSGHLDVVTALMEKGADKDNQLSDGSTALMVAASHSHAGIVRALVSAGADTTLTNNDESCAKDLIGVDNGCSGAQRKEIEILLDIDTDSQF